jgi:hypothetical protein
MSSNITYEHYRILDRFPPALKALVEAEIAAGNTIIDAGAGHPAPPAGHMIKLAHDLRTRTTDVNDGLSVYPRNTSTHHTEITDADRFFFILTAAHPPPPLPDMNAIRDARNYSPLPLVTPVVHAPGSIEMDYRGEMLIYHEAGRSTDIVWTWNRGNHYYRSSLTHWWYPAERRSVPFTDEEKETVLAKFIGYQHTHIGSTVKVVD